MFLFFYGAPGTGKTTLASRLLFMKGGGLYVGEGAALDPLLDYLESKGSAKRIVIELGVGKVTIGQFNRLWKLSQAGPRLEKKFVFTGASTRRGGHRDAHECIFAYSDVALCTVGRSGNHLRADFEKHRFGRLAINADHAEVLQSLKKVF